ncbi:MAG: leucine-rich repeat domain-containing protein [Microscillaceae bacterium]|nr:leucine-rich repeat domain-containing protein [Microscillaceae bacterium]
MMPKQNKWFLGIILNLVFLMAISRVSAQEISLLSEPELMKKPVYSNLMQAFREYDRVYRMSLKGSGGYYGKVTAVHPDIDSLRNLQYFYVVNEGLKDLPNSFGALRFMQHLYLSGNQFEAIPDTLYSLRHLKRLDLQKNQLKAVSDKIGQLVELEFLYLNDNPDLDYLPLEPLAKLKKLRYLNVKGTKISREQMAALQARLPMAQIEY